MHVAQCTASILAATKKRNYKRNDREQFEQTPGKIHVRKKNVEFQTSKTMCVNNNILYRFVCHNKDVKKNFKNTVFTENEYGNFNLQLMTINRV